MHAGPGHWCATCSRELAAPRCYVTHGRVDLPKTKVVLSVRRHRNSQTLKTFRRPLQRLQAAHAPHLLEDPAILAPQEKTRYSRRR